MKFSWRVGRKGMASSGALSGPVGSWRVLGVDVEVSMVLSGLLSDRLLDRSEG